MAKRMEWKGYLSKLQIALRQGELSNILEGKINIQNDLGKLEQQDKTNWMTYSNDK